MSIVGVEKRKVFRKILATLNNFKLDGKIFNIPLYFIDICISLYENGC